MTNPSSGEIGEGGRRLEDVVAEEKVGEDKTIEIKGDLEIQDTATVKVDSLRTKGNGRFKVGGRSTMKISKDPRQTKKSKPSEEKAATKKSGVRLGCVAKDHKDGKSSFEKKARRTKRVDQNVAKMLEEDEEPTTVIVNEKLRSLGIRSLDAGEEPDLILEEGKVLLSKAFHIKRRAVSLVCSDQTVRRTKEKDASNVGKKRCRDLMPTVSELKEAIVGRGVEIEGTVASVEESSVKTLKWELFKIASRTRVLAKIMAKSGAYKEKVANVEETKTKEERSIFMKDTLKKMLQKKKMERVKRKIFDKRIGEAEEEETAAENKEEEEESVDRECKVCVDAVPQCLPTCGGKCYVTKTTCDTCSEAVCSEDVERETELLFTLENIMEECEKEEEREDLEREEVVDFELGADAFLEIEGGELRLDGTSSVKGQVMVDGSSIVVCGRGAKVDMTSDGDEDDAPNSSEEVEGAEVVSDADDETDKTPRTKIHGTVELEEGARLEVDSMVIGATGVVSGAGDIEIKTDPRTVAVVEGGGRRLEEGIKKFRSKRSKVTISSSDVLDESAKTKVKEDRIRKKRKRHAKRITARRRPI